MRLVLGADPGKSGCITAITENGDLAVFRFAKKKNVQLLDWLRGLIRHEILGCGIEAVHARPSDTPVTAFGFGYSLGALVMALDSVGIVHTRIESKAWQHEFNLGGP